MHAYRFVALRCWKRMAGTLKSSILPYGGFLAVLVVASLAMFDADRTNAADWYPAGTSSPDVEFHGFASQGFLYSSQYNYLGKSSKGSFKFTEMGLNASFDPFPRTRIMVGGFADDVGEAGKYDAVLDYALAEYTISDYFGIRAGRIRRPDGIYNDIQDVDLGRTFVLLPQGIYDARYRDFNVSLDGGEFFGTLPLQQAGSLSYELYGGLMRPSLDGGVGLQLRNSLPSNAHLDTIDPMKIFGDQLWWNSPIDGLRLGASVGYISGFDYSAVIPTPVGPLHLSDPSDILLQTYSAEYLWKNWTLQSECIFTDTLTKTLGTPDVRQFSWYAAGAFRINKWLEVGSYYTEYYSNAHSPGIIPSDGFQKDAAISLRFDLTNRWIFKVEGHLIHGTGLLQDNVDNPVRHDNGWLMIAVKSTISF